MKSFLKLGSDERYFEKYGFHPSNDDIRGEVEALDIIKLVKERELKLYVNEEFIFVSKLKYLLVPTNIFSKHFFVISKRLSNELIPFAIFSREFLPMYNHARSRAIYAEVFSKTPKENKPYYFNDSQNQAYDWVDNFYHNSLSCELNNKVLCAVFHNGFGFERSLETFKRVENEIIKHL